MIVDKAPAGNMTLPANTSLIVLRKLTVPANGKLSIGSDAILRIG